MARPGLATQQGGAGNRIDQTGTFRLPNVAPGRYQVQARSGGRDFEIARMDLMVGAEDVEGLTLVTAPGATINGAIVSDTGEPFDFKPPQVQIAARPGSPDAARRRPGARRLARRRRLVVLASQPHRRRADSRAGAAGVGDEVGGHQRPGHHRYADGISGGTNRQRHADRADEEDHVAGRADHRLTRQPGPRRDRRRVSQRREAVDLSVAIHQGGAARSGRQVSSDRASRPGALPGGRPAGPRGRAGRRSRVSRDDQRAGDKSRTWRGRNEVG